jgi:hypothetical protein
MRRGAYGSRHFASADFAAPLTSARTRRRAMANGAILLNMDGNPKRLGSRCNNIETNDPMHGTNDLL